LAGKKRRDSGLLFPVVLTGIGDGLPETGLFRQTEKITLTNISAYGFLSPLLSRGKIDGQKQSHRNTGLLFQLLFLRRGLSVA
jgi:hypothetical protein